MENGGRIALLSPSYNQLLLVFFCVNCAVALDYILFMQFESDSCSVVSDCL